MPPIPHTPQTLAWSVTRFIKTNNNNFISPEPENVFGLVLTFKFNFNTNPNKQVP